MMTFRSKNIAVLNYPVLNLTAEDIGNSLAVLTAEDPSPDLIPTAIGVVTSVKTFVMGRLVVNVLRSKVAAAAAWIEQARRQPIVGSVTIFPELPATPVTLENSTIIGVRDSYDGSDPTVAILIDGAVPNVAALTGK
jgi:hypothetical protein